MPTMHGKTLWENWKQRAAMVREYEKRRNEISVETDGVIK